ncbi:MAG: sulfatase-like hydrolase/transferase [Lachnospiraceae bacterium]|nr:sulfatase-like hydrolase/transferase [Lachnospiraceae bacterium]
MDSNSWKAKFLRLCEKLNKYSLVFHAILACLVCFIIEAISRHSVIRAVSFMDKHTLAFLYNALIVFSSLSIVYIFRRRAFIRVLICELWIVLGIVNGCVLAKRITPFGYTDLKCINDLFQMQNAHYYNTTQLILYGIGAVLFIVNCVLLIMYGPKYKGKRRLTVSAVIVVLSFSILPFTTKAAQSSNILASYFANIAKGYEDYGFIYGFSASVVGTGMSEPDTYVKEHVDEIVASSKRKEDTSNDPNIIVVLLESMIDPNEVKFLNYSKDPVPFYHELEQKYTSGYLTVPVVGAGTANTEFEVLTGMSMRYFGTGEYPYKTVLKKTDCESIAADLSSLGYGTHVVHNNGGNFYSRANAFSQMGFDSFTSKELMDIKEYTPLADWPTDDILVDETCKALDSTEGKDFVYTISVQCHGEYPEEKVIENPEIVVTGAESLEENYKWEYYMNMAHEEDAFMKKFTEALDKRGEDTIVVFFGDHYPSMKLEDKDVVSGDIFKTKYLTWNNFGATKKDADYTAYQLLAGITNNLGIHEGTMFTYHQSKMDALNSIIENEEYYDGLDNLQYDILYGERYCYNGEDAYPATDLVMGIDEVTIREFVPYEMDQSIIIRGEHFTKWSHVYINDEKVATKYVSANELRVNMKDLQFGDNVCVKQLGSKETVFRESNKLPYLIQNKEEE